MHYLYNLAEKTVKKHGTRNPFRLLESMGVLLRYSYEYEPNGLKGFTAIMGNIMFVVLNGHLTEFEKRIVAGHEAAHLILHKREIANSPLSAMRDFNIYNNSGRLEYEANSFLSDFLVSDEDMMDVITDTESDLFFCASILNLPPQLYVFKLKSMKERGFDVHFPLGIRGGFLK